MFRRSMPIPFLLVLLTTSCYHAPKVATVALPVKLGTALPSLRSPSGKLYARTRVAPPDNDEPVIQELRPGIVQTGDDFRGTARRTAKLSIASGTLQLFTDMGAILDSLIPDDQMRAMNISKAADSGRLDSEQTQVTVSAFLFASSRESDNDFHCIVGLDPSQPARFMNVEVSGLPSSDSSSFAVLTTARNEFKTFFTTNGDSLPSGGYDKYDPPIPITITGSLFFDVDHIPPAVGPTGMKPQTAWEIHPVSDIQFEP